MIECPWSGGNLKHVLVLGEAHLHRVLREHVAFFNTKRPHQGL